MRIKHLYRRRPSSAGLRSTPSSLAVCRFLPIWLVPSPQKSRLSATVPARSRLRVCLSNTRGERPSPVPFARHDGGTFMKKLALGMAAVLALLSIAGCAQYYGKGKAPPPVVTKG